MVNTVVVEQVLDASVRDTWDTLADTSRWREWMGISGVTVERPSSTGPLGLGTVYVVRGLVTDRFEVVEFVPPHRFGYRMLSGGWPVRNYRSDLTLTEQGRGTALRWRATFEPKIRNSGWLFALVIRAVLRRTTRKLTARLSTNPS